MISPLDHPQLSVEGYRKTSECSGDYNCIAWAASDQTKWWWPGKDLQGNETYWPPRAPRVLSLHAFAAAFKSIGYANCKNGDIENGYEKIAIYALNGVSKHAARQLPDGKWTHKMGRDIDLTASLTAVCGPVYGNVVRFMRRPNAKAPIAPKSTATTKKP